MLNNKFILLRILAISLATGGIVFLGYRVLFNNLLLASLLGTITTIFTIGAGVLTILSMRIKQKFLEDLEHLEQRRRKPYRTYLDENVIVESIPAKVPSSPPRQDKPAKPSVGLVRRTKSQWNRFPPKIKILLTVAAIFCVAISSIFFYIIKTNTPPTTLCLATDLPMSGPVETTGLDIRNGVELAVIQSPLSKTYHGYDLKKFYMDNSSQQQGGGPDPATGVKNIQNLFQQTSCSNPIAIIGPYDSSVAAAEIPLAAQNHILLLSPANAASCLTQKNFSEPHSCNYDSIHPQGFSNTYARLPGADTVQGSMIANFLLASPNSKNPEQGGLGAQKIVIVGDEEIYGTQLSQMVIQELKHNGVKPIGIDCVKPPQEYSKNPSCSLNPGTNAFSTDNIAALATKIRDEQPDAIFFGGRPDRGASLLRKQLGELGLDQVPFVGPSALVTNKDAFFKTIGSHATNVYATFPVADPSTFTSGTATTFSKEYQKLFGKYPGTYSANGYDAANIILQAIKDLIDAGKPVTRENVAQAVLSGNFTGVAGNNIHFDQNGDNIGQRVYTIYQSQQDSQGAWDFKVYAQRVV
jgi:branched-chain amino acid transport system substrate-binding protein